MFASKSWSSMKIIHVCQQMSNHSTLMKLLQFVSAAQINPKRQPTLYTCDLLISVLDWDKQAGGNQFQQNKQLSDRHTCTRMSSYDSSQCPHVSLASHLFIHWFSHSFVILVISPSHYNSISQNHQTSSHRMHNLPFQRQTSSFNAKLQLSTPSFNFQRQTSTFNAKLQLSTPSFDTQCNKR